MVAFTAPLLPSLPRPCNILPLSVLRFCPISVTVSISHLYKHNMPVAKGCSWEHYDGVTAEDDGCHPVSGRSMKNWEDMLACMHERPCSMADDRLQMLVLRDPRAVVVSSYYYLKKNQLHVPRAIKGETVDAFAVRMLPPICRFVHMRYALLREKVPDQTVEFFYNDSLADPLQWHRRWLSSAGLNVPDSVVLEATDTALRRKFGFAAKGIDKHIGGNEAAPSRSYRDELSPEASAQLDHIVRAWLPPALLRKFGVPPS